MISKKSKKRSFFQWVLIILTILSVLCLLLSYAAFFVSPAKAWILAFFGLAYPLILAVNLLFIILWLILWKKYIWIPLIPVLIGFSHILSVIEIRSNEGPPVSGSLKVLSYNIHGHSEYYKRPSTNGNFDAVLDFLSQQQPDILCLQEFYSNAKDSTQVFQRISEKINMKYSFFKNYYQSKNKKKRKIDALVIFSKYPIIRTGSYQVDHKSTNAIYVDVAVDEEIFRVYNVHLESFQFGQDDYTFYSNLKEVETDKTPIQEGTRKIMVKLRRAYELRAKQVDNLRSSIKKSPYPLLVCGDLNDTPSSYTYQVMSRGLQDSFKKAGNGLIGNTFRGNLPSFRIDYILFDKKFEAYNYEKINISLSDHYPISVFINIHPAK
jgi:endonuclease/exonuclease/phosphatase family metal-dependent hydrolase